MGASAPLRARPAIMRGRPIGVRAVELLLVVAAISAILASACTGEIGGANTPDGGEVLDDRGPGSPTDAEEPTTEDGSAAADGGGEPIDAGSRDTGPRVDAGSSPYSCAGWEALGGALDFDAANYASTPSLAVDSGGRLFATWHEMVAGEDYNIFVKQWNGSAWVLLGAGPLDVVRGAMTQAPVVAIDVYDRPVVVWTEGRSLFVARWEGSAWELLGGSLTVSSASDAYPSLPNIATDGDGNPVVAWNEWDSALRNDVYVKRWTGSDWRLLGGGPVDLDPAASASWPSIAMTPDGTPIVAWNETTAALGPRTYAKRWSGTAWVQVSDGPILATASGVETHSPSLVIDRSGRPVIALYEYDTSTSESTGRVFRFASTEWDSLGGSVAGGTDTRTVDTTPSLDGDDRPLVAFTDSKNEGTVRAAAWSGTAWTAIGDALDRRESEVAFAPDMIIDPLGKPAVAWTEWDPPSNTMNIYVSRCR